MNLALILLPSLARTMRRRINEARDVVAGVRPVNLVRVMSMIAHNADLRSEVGHERRESLDIDSAYFRAVVGS